MKVLIEVVVDSGMNYFVTDESGNRVVQKADVPFLVQEVKVIEESKSGVEEDFEGVAREKEALVEEKEQDFEEDVLEKERSLSKADFERVTKQKVKDAVPPGFKRQKK